MEHKISELNIYPLKSGGALKLHELHYDKAGPRWDRVWMLVKTDTGKFLSQRNFPQMARMRPTMTNDKLIFQWDHLGFELDLKKEPAKTKQVDVWTKVMTAHEEPEEISRMISDFLNSEVTLVRYGSLSQRDVLVSSKKVGTETRFADSQPILLTNTKSLENLNSLLQTKIPMDRFRANVIINGVEAFEEDRAEFIQAPDLKMELTKRCSRCVIVTTDQQNGEPQEKEPLQVLKKINAEGKIQFGSYYHSYQPGILRVGDSLVLKPREVI